MNGQDLAPLRRDMYQESLTTDSLAKHLEARVAAIEEVLAPVAAADRGPGPARPPAAALGAVLPRQLVR